MRYRRLCAHAIVMCHLHVNVVFVVKLERTVAQIVDLKVVIGPKTRGAQYNVIVVVVGRSETSDFDGTMNDRPRRIAVVACRPLIPFTTFEHEVKFHTRTKVGKILADLFVLSAEHRFIMRFQNLQAVAQENSQRRSKTVMGSSSFKIS